MCHCNSRCIQNGYKCKKKKVYWIINLIEISKALNAYWVWFTEAFNSAQLLVCHMDKQWAQVLPTTEQMYSEQMKHKVHLGTMKTKWGGQVTGWKQVLTGNISPLQLPEERQGLERNQHQAADMPIHLLITGSTDKVNSEADCAFSMWLLTLV